MDSTDAQTAAAAIPSEVALIRALLRQQQFSWALVAGDALLAEAPEHRDASSSTAQGAARGGDREGLDQWKHFEPWLESLKNALGDALSRYRDQEAEYETGSQRSVPVR